MHLILLINEYIAYNSNVLCNSQTINLPFNVLLGVWLGILLYPSLHTRYVHFPWELMDTTFYDNTHGVGMSSELKMKTKMLLNQVNCVMVTTVNTVNGFYILPITVKQSQRQSPGKLTSFEPYKSSILFFSFFFHLNRYFIALTCKQLLLKA